MGHVWLIGMMGSGKTSVARSVADRLGSTFVDTDDAVVLAAGRSIEDLFAESETAFRSVEHDVILTIASLPAQVIASGGGAILDPANVVAMRSSGATILLETDSETLVARLAGSVDRPLLVEKGDIDRIALDREAAYQESADFTIDTTNRSIEEVADEVVACVTM